MKETFRMILATALVAFVAAGCAKQSELDEVIGRIDGIENRVSRLEDEVKKLNEQEVPGLRALVQGIMGNVTVASVVETDESYTITFSDGTVATIRNGRDGKDGQGVDGLDGVGIESVKEVEGGYLITMTNGDSFTLYHGQAGLDAKQIGVALVDGVYVWTIDGEVLKDSEGNPVPLTGADGVTPEVSITLVDGEYYWTVNGAILKDEEGNPIPVAGKDGTDGVTPQFGILDGHWVVSYDNGETWKTLGLTSDTDYSAYIDPDKETDDYIVLVVGATEVQIPKEKAFTLTFTTIENNGVDAGATVAFPYVISGVNASDETDVDVIGIIGDWTAEVVPTDNASGVLNVTATENGTAKVTVYAANHKGKADIRTLKFEGSVLEAIIETKDIDWEGGELDLAVKTNVSYHIFIPAAAEDWITVTPETKVRTDNYTITVAKNETGAYRMATLQVLDKAGKSVKDIEILQYANPEAATDLASVLALPDDKACFANGLTVVAASKKGVVVTDGENFGYVAGYTGEAGTVINVTGTKKTDEIGQAYIDAAEAKVDAEAEAAEVDPKENYLYYGMGQNGIDFYFTSYNGVLVEKDGVYYLEGFEAPQQFVVEDPVQDMTSLVGQLVALSGWVKTVDFEEDVKEDIHIVLSDIHAVSFEQEIGWELYYGGPNSGESGYPEVIGNTVASPVEGNYYSLNVYSAASVAEYDSFGSFLFDSLCGISDEVLYYITLYNLYTGDDFDTAFDYLAHLESAEECFREFPYGQYVIVAAGVDGLGRLSGKFTYKVFEKEDPAKHLEYEDFLGTWKVDGTQWEISQKENGVSYNIDGIPGSGAMATRGGNTTVTGYYDSEAGQLYVMEEEMASYDDNSGYGYGPLKDYLSAWFSYGTKEYMYYPVNSSKPEKIFTLAGFKDGSYEIRAGSCPYGPFTKFMFHWVIQTGSYQGQGNSYGTVEFPINSVEKVEVISAKYEDFLGTWKVGDEDTWKISVNEDGASYKVEGIYGLTSVYSGGQPVIAQFNAAKSAFTIPAQYLGQFNSDEIDAFSQNPYGMCADFLSGLFVYYGDVYPAYPLNTASPEVICTGTFNKDGNVDLTPGSCAYGTFSYLGFSWVIMTGEDQGKGNNYSYFTELPSQMVKLSGSSSSTSSRDVTVHPEMSVLSATPAAGSHLIRHEVVPADGQPARSRMGGMAKARKF